MFSVKASLKGNISFSFKLFPFDVYFLFALLSNQLFFEFKVIFSCCSSCAVFYWLAEIETTILAER